MGWRRLAEIPDGWRVRAEIPDGRRVQAEIPDGWRVRAVAGPWLVRREFTADSPLIYG